MSGEDKELKSAFDIAMERAQKLGAMSAEEKQRSREEEFRAIGQSWKGKRIKLGAARRKELKLRGISGSAV